MNEMELNINQIKAIKDLANNHIVLIKAIKSPNYPDTIYTQIALNKVDAKIKQMCNNPKFKEEFEKLIPFSLSKIL